MPYFPGRRTARRKNNPLSQAVPKVLRTRLTIYGCLRPASPCAQRSGWFFARRCPPAAPPPTFPSGSFLFLHGVEGVLRVVLVHVLLVRLVQVLAQHHVAVFAHRLQACLLCDGRDVGRADLLRPVDVIL